MVNLELWKESTAKSKRVREVGLAPEQPSSGRLTHGR
jgi:hypothetical protein